VIKGDIVRTSGIDTIYPEGLAVAEIVEINNDPKLPFAKIICKPIASIRNHTHLLVVMPSGNLNNSIPFKNDKKQ
jgi:rod shape-determining protein MreC